MYIVKTFLQDLLENSEAFPCSEQCLSWINDSVVKVNYSYANEYSFVIASPKNVLHLSPNLLNTSASGFQKIFFLSYESLLNQQWTVANSEQWLTVNSG